LTARRIGRMTNRPSFAPEPAMSAVLLALVVAATPAPDGGDAVEYPAPRARDFRAGGGATTFVDVDGVAPTAEIGLEVPRWRHVALRFTFGTALRVGWGTVYLAPEAVFRILPRDARVSPYVSAGLQAAVLNLTDEARDVPDAAESRAAATGENVAQGEYAGGAGPLPLKFSAGPQAGLGTTFPAFGTTFDVGVRYNLHFWEGEAYSGVGVLLTVVGPMSF
jgi:hypothetical protein